MLVLFDANSTQLVYISIKHIDIHQNGMLQMYLTILIQSITV